jgi:hypothetical protein
MRDVPPASPVVALARPSVETMPAPRTPCPPPPPRRRQALAKLSPEDAAGEWHFCRGVLEVDTQEFKTYEEVEAGEGAPAGAY